MYQIQGGGKFEPELLLIAGVVIQYIATRIAVTALGRADGSAPGRLALGQWLPILATALAAVAKGQPAMAMALIFGSSVASFSLVLGMTIYVNPMKRFPPEKRVWPLVLPVAILLLLAGFKGRLTWYHAVMLLIMGAAFLAVWRERPAEAGEAPAANGLPVPPGFMTLAIVLAGLGGWAIARGAILTSSRLLTPELMASTILSPLLLLPALGAGTMLAQNGYADRAVTSLCGTVLLNLCLLLPVVILIEFLIGARHGHPQPLVFPLITWRIDTVLLVVLGFALVPIATGRWLPGRTEAMLLVTLYVAYLAGETLEAVGLFWQLPPNN